MTVELYINGRLFQQWDFQHADYHEAFCQVGFAEKERLWEVIKAKCLEDIDIQRAILHSAWALYFTIPARIQPADVDPEEQERLLSHIIENKNSIL